MAEKTPGYVQVQTATDSLEAATKIARSSVEARLAACAQVVGPITSTYRWQGQVEVAEEWLVLIKTADEKLDDLVTHIRGEHSYDTPEIIATPIIGGNADYLAWITSTTTPAADA